MEAFKSTLEEAAQADIILNVCDASSEESRLHLDVTRELLASLSSLDKPIIPVLNKCDLLADNMTGISGAVHISAKYGAGIDDLLKAIEENLPKKLKRVKLLLPFDKAGIAAKLRETAVLHSEEYTAEGIAVEVTVDEIQYARVRNYLVD